MQSFQFAPGDTSQSVDIFLPDSSSTTGAGLSGLAFNTAGLKAYYRNTATGTVTAITLATQTVGGAYSSGGIVELDATNAKGMYRFDVPNAVLTSAGNGFVFFYGATNLAPVPVQIVVGYPKIDVRQLLGTAWLTPGVAGTPDVNAKQINAVSTSSVTTINANVGTTQQTNFTGTGASALVKGDAIDWNSVAVTGMPMPTYTQPTGFLAEDFSELDADIEAIQTGVAAIPTNPYIGPPPTAAAIATAVWQDTTAGDFTVATSPGKIIFTQLGGAFTNQTGSVFSAPALANAPGGGNVTVGGYASGQDPATLVLDVAAAAHNVAGSIGAKINSAGGAADPLANQTAGHAAGTGYAALDRIGTGVAALSQPVSADGGTINTIRGNDYFFADSADLNWTNPGGWPDLTGATIALSSYGSTSAALLTKAGSVVTPTGPTAKVRVELAKAEVLALAAGRYTFDLTATLADGHVRTLARGTHSNNGPL